MKIIFENESLLVINKPANMHSVGADSLAEQLISSYPNLATISADAGFVQRLDFETSGLMLVGKTTVSHELLRKSILNGDIKKEYTALLEGALNSSKLVDTFIGSRHRGSKKVSIYTYPAPRRLHAKSEFNPLQKYGHATLAKITASPARRHQVRAHAAFIGHTLIGDSLYGSKIRLTDVPEILPKIRDIHTRRFYLEACKITIPDELGERLGLGQATVFTVRPI